MNKKRVLILVAIIGLITMSLIGIKLNQNGFTDPYEIKSTDTYEEKQYKSAFNPPNREHSIHNNIDLFKNLKRGDKYKDFAKIVSGEDFALTPDKLYPQGSRLEYVVNSNKISFIFLGFKEGSPGYTEE